MSRSFGFETVLVALLLGHLIGDFLLQTKSIVIGKHRRRHSAYAMHVGAHYVASLLVLQPYLETWWGGPLVQGVLIGACAIHWVVDLGKIGLAARGAGVGGFLADQAAHVATVAGAAALIAPIAIDPYDPSRIERWMEPAIAPVAVVIAVLFATGWLFRFLLMPLEPGDDDAGRIELVNAGMYIGWLERTLILLAVLARSPEAVGLVFVGKSIVRFPSLKDRPFAEYFLIGTMLSVLVAVAGGLLLLSMGYGIG